LGTFFVGFGASRENLNLPISFGLLFSWVRLLSRLKMMNPSCINPHLGSLTLWTFYAILSCIFFGLKGVNTILMISALITKNLNRLGPTWWKWGWPLGEPSTFIRFLRTLTIMLTLTLNSDISGAILEFWGLMSPLLGRACYPMCISLTMFIANVVFPTFPSKVFIHD